MEGLAEDSMLQSSGPDQGIAGWDKASVHKLVVNLQNKHLMKLMIENSYSCVAS